MRILIVEDDAGIASGLAATLRGAGYAVDICDSLARAGTALRTESFDMALLDLGLPDGDGIDWLRSLRQEGRMLPVLIMTARDEVQQRIAGLDLGADDYLVKPYDPEELLARLRAIERRRSQQAAAQVVRGSVHIDLVREGVQVAGLPVVLTPKEWALLRVLASRPGQIFTRERLQEALYQWDASSDSNTLEVFISRLRRKLGSSLIQTVRGVGYRLEAA